MPTINPKLQGYILPNLHQRFTAWKKERHLEKDSQALNILLSEFFEEAIPTVETADSQRLHILEDTVKNLSQQLEALTKTVAIIQSTGRLPSNSSPLTSLSDASNKEQSEVTHQASESAIAPAPTYRFANLEETITPSETISSENLGIETVAESSTINSASNLPNKLLSNLLTADVQDSPSVIPSESINESLAVQPSEQSEVTTQTSEGAIAQAPTCRFAHIEDSLFISNAINPGSSELDTATEPSRANTQSDLPDDLLDESLETDVQVNQVITSSDSLGDPLKNEPLDQTQLDINQPSELLTAAQLAKLFRVSDRAVSIAAEKGHEYFKEWSAKKGKGTWDFQVLNLGNKKVKREFFRLTRVK